MNSLQNTATSAVLVSRLWPVNNTTIALRAIALTVIGACLITVGAKIQVPFWPVPMTMQTFAVMLLAACYGRNLGVASVVAYLAAGAAGFPVFANTPPAIAGLAYFMGPTGGFLLGFIPLAWIVGMIADRDSSSWMKVGVAGIVGHIVLFAIGLSWLAAMVPALREIGALYTKGLEPFILSTVFKIALVTACYAAAERVMRKS